MQIFSPRRREELRDAEAAVREDAQEGLHLRRLRCLQGAAHQVVAINSAKGPKTPFGGFQRATNDLLGAVFDCFCQRSLILFLSFLFSSVLVRGRLPSLAARAAALIRRAPTQAPHTHTSVAFFGPRRSLEMGCGPWRSTLALKASQSAFNSTQAAATVAP